MSDKCFCREEVKPTYRQLKNRNEELELKLNQAEKLIQALEISLSNLATSNDSLNNERLYWKSQCEELREELKYLNTKNKDRGE